MVKPLKREVTAIPALRLRTAWTALMDHRNRDGHHDEQAKFFVKYGVVQKKMNDLQPKWIVQWNKKNYC